MCEITHYAESQCDVILKLQVEAETASLAYLAAEEMTSQHLSQSRLRGYWRDLGPGQWAAQKVLHCLLVEVPGGDGGRIQNIVSKHKFISAI